ncbi:MAG: hypothetical protein KatS3mg032_0550 [Cyclobacteriaceae bacterium]|nr:MAG: hypothetical protein KatS3mg032_0550 [Cyclobacteriaceae bacterium]
MRCALGCTICLLLTFGNCPAQSHSEDSLLSILKRTTKNYEKFEIYKNLIRTTYARNDAEALNRGLDYAQKLLNLAKLQSDSASIVWAGRVLGQFYNKLERPKDALEILNQVLPVAKRNKLEEEEKRILNNLGLAYTFLAEYHRALEIYYQVLVLREQDGNLPEIAATLNNIGLAYFKLRNFAKALEFYEMALARLNEGNITDFLDQQYANIGLCYNQLKQFNLAREAFNKALEVCKPNCTDKVQVNANFGLGVTHYGMKEYDEAELQFRKALDLASQSNDVRYIGENNIFLAKVKIALNQLDAAIPFLQQAEQIAQSQGFNELLIDTYRQYSILYSQSANYQMASEYQQKYIQLKDSVYSEELIDRIARIQTHYAERENLAIIRAKEEVIRRQRMLNYSIGLIAVLAASMVFILFRSNIVVKKVNQALSQAKQELEALNLDLDNKVREKTASLEKLNREMEHFIYKSSHDIRGPLATLKGLTGVALMDVKDPVAIDYMQRLDSTATKLNRVLSRLLIINQVNQATLTIEPVKVNEVVDEIINQESRNGLPPRMKIIKEIPQGLVFPSDRQLLGIILSNLIDNALKYHTQSDRVEPFVRIKAGMENGVLKVNVIDNGIGVNAQDSDKIFQIFYRGTEKSETGGVGLYLCRLATERLQGKIGVAVTHQEHHTNFFVELPEIPNGKAVA